MRARIEAAKERLDAGYAVLLRAKEAGPPCAGCIHYAPPKWTRGAPAHQRREGPWCAHLAYTEQSFDTVSGALTQTVQVPAVQARGEDGLCGYEATLFEPRTEHPAVTAFKLVRRGLWWIFLYLWSSFVVWFAIISFLRWAAS